jgi:hypothetical protein
MRRRALILTLILVAALAGAARGADFTLRSDGWHAPDKPAAAVLDYTVDWSLWLAGDTISTSAWVCDTGITSTPVVLGSSKTKASTWLSGGAPGTTYNVTNTIITTGGRTEVVSFKIHVF